MLACSLRMSSMKTYPDNNVHGANMGPTWVLSAPDGPHVGPMNLAVRVDMMLTLSPRVAPAVVFTTFCVIRNDKVGILTTLDFKWWWRKLPGLTSYHRISNLEMMLTMVTLLPWGKCATVPEPGNSSDSYDSHMSATSHKKIQQSTYHVHITTVVLQRKKMLVRLHKYGSAAGTPRVVKNRNLLSHLGDLRMEAYIIRMT